MHKPGIRSIIVLFMAILLGCSQQPERGQAGHPDSNSLVGEKSFVSGYEARNPDGTINVVIEIPAGTNAKWEVDKSDGSMKWEIRDEKPRVVQYLPYPANYGMIPKTYLPESQGGDGDPLDVIALGPALPRGSIAKARIIGVLNLIDTGQMDDKLLAVVKDSPFANVKSLDELNARFPGVTEILKTWFTSYKGPGVLESSGYGNSAEAVEILNQAIRAYQDNR